MKRVATWPPCAAPGLPSASHTTPRGDAERRRNGLKGEDVGILEKDEMADALFLELGEKARLEEERVHLR